MITIDGYVVDAFLSEEHTLDSEATDYPTESGGNVTDNIRPLPITVTVEGVVSDTPIGNLVQVRQRETSSGDDDLEFLPSDEALSKLTKIRDKHDIIVIETALKRYENMAMINLTITVDADTGHALSFKATFKQIRIVTNNRILIKVAPPTSTSLGAGAKKTKTPPEFDPKHPMIWHNPSAKTKADGTKEVVGWDHDAAKKTGNGFAHKDGTALTDGEVSQMRDDNNSWRATHDANGNLIIPDNQRELGPNEAGNPTTSGRHSTLPVFRNSDGTWVDEAGAPVQQNPNFGNWYETAPAPTTIGGVPTGY